MPEALSSILNPEELAPSHAYTSKSETATVPTSELYVPTWNPRPVIDEEELLDLMAYIENDGIIPRIILWRGNGQPPCAIISGQMRTEAYRRLGKTYIEAEIYDISLQKAKIMALAANKSNKPHWLGEFEALANIEKENPDLSNVELKPAGWNNKRVSYALSLNKLLTPTARELIRQSKRKKLTQSKLFTEKDNKDASDDAIWQFTERVAYCLSPLLSNPSREAAQAQTEKAVQVIIDHQLSSIQTADFVAFILAGGNITEYQPTAKVRKARPAKTSPPPNSGTSQNTGILSTSEAQKTATPKEVHHSTLPSELYDKVVELGPNHVAKAPAPHADSPTESAQPKHASQQAMGTAETLAWDTLAGISLISVIKAKIKKGERPSLGEFFLLLGHLLKKPFKWTAKKGIKGIFHGLKWVWKNFIESLKITGLYPFFRAVCVLASMAFILWFAWQTYNYGWMKPVRVIGSRIPIVSWFFKPSQPSPEVSSSTPAPAPAVVVSRPVEAKEKTKSETKPAPAGISYSGVKPWDNSLEDQAYLEAELAALPPNALIQSVAFTPGAMNFDMASRRLADISDGEKYSVRLGADKRKVLTIVTSASNCVLTFQPDLLGGAAKMEIYWEDVQALHVNVIQAVRPLGAPSKLYQLALFVSDGKKPLIVQTNGASNLERLVSALEFDLKNSRGSYAPITGLPYLNQGLRLGGEGKITTLWAGSPADKAGVKLGEYAWSLDQNTKQQQPLANLENGLRSLASGTYDFYVVTGAEWAKAVNNRDYNHSYSFNPARQKVALSVP
jgi:hypothetical protein